jgi:D-glycero-beta-D-manno-heptose-7-phosphate kinase
MKDAKDVNIFLVGDIMLDKYIVGDVDRISPEAPVPVVKVTDEFETLGGAGNVARNLRAIGSEVRCIGLTGYDREGARIENMLKEIGATPRLLGELSTTIIKQRIIADERKIQMLRMDWEDLKITESIVDLLIEIIKENYSSELFDYIVVSDYAKGVVSQKLMTYLSSLPTPIIVDPKPQNKRYYGNVEMITPNLKEWHQMIESCKAEFALITEGKDGMTLIDYRQSQGVLKIPGHPVEVYNVSGAGDTVVAVMATCLGMGIYPDKAARIANECAAYVVTKPGTSIINENKFTEIMQRYIS